MKTIDLAGVTTRLPWASTYQAGDRITMVNNVDAPCDVIGCRGGAIVVIQPGERATFRCEEFAGFLGPQRQWVLVEPEVEP